MEYKDRLCLFLSKLSEKIWYFTSFSTQDFQMQVKYNAMFTKPRWFYVNLSKTIAN